MNLFDLFTRSDRMLAVLAGTAKAHVLRGKPKTLGVHMEAGTRFRLRDAGTAHGLKCFPRTLNWELFSEGDAAVNFRVIIRASTGERHPLAWLTHRSDLGRAIFLDWPIWAGFVPQYALEFENLGSEPVILGCTRFIDSRTKFAGLLRGVGVEVGPGMNPFVKPSPEVSVRYIEAAAAENWATTAGTGIDAALRANAATLWERYIVGNAQTLDMIEDGELDFIFSAHVVEHLMNPLGVLENWRRKLRPGGYVVAVVPDCRFCFDLRQTPSTMAEWRDEELSESWEAPRVKYETFFAGSAPSASVDEAIANNVSVHLHFYTSESIAELLRETVQRGLYDGFNVNSAPNNKEFAFALRSPA